MGINLKKQFGQNLQKYRKLRKLTQEQLAEIVELDATSISSIETGKFFPTADNLQKIANALNIKLETLFFFENESSEEDIYNEVLGTISSIKTDKHKMYILRNFLHTLI